MLQSTKTSLIQDEIERQIDKGTTDIQDIYTIVCDKFGIPRSTARRSKKELLLKLKYKVQILDAEAKRGPILKAKPSNVEKLAPVEERILQLLKQKDEDLKFSVIHRYLNSFPEERLVKKKKLTYYLGKLCAADLIKKVGESRYSINMLVCISKGIFNTFYGSDKK